jgi:hypothetical protein
VTLLLRQQTPSARAPWGTLARQGLTLLVSVDGAATDVVGCAMFLCSIIQPVSV